MKKEKRECNNFKDGFQEKNECYKMEGQNIIGNECQN